MNRRQAIIANQVAEVAMKFFLMDRQQMEIDFIKNDEVSACNDFHNQAYGAMRTEEQWRWLFNQACSDVLPFIVAKEGGRIVGTQALIPITMVGPEGDMPTAKSEETLIHPSMRGRGVFQKMYDPLFKYADAHGIRAIWGFTPAYKPFISVGFDVPGSTAQLLLPFSTRAISTYGEHLGVGIKRLSLTAATAALTAYSEVRLALSGERSGFEVKVLNSAPQESGSLCREFAKSWGGLTILRDEDYLNWRYFRNPFLRATLIGIYRENRLLGWLAYAIDESSVGYIIDAIVPKHECSVDVLATLMARAVRALRAAGAIAVRSWSVNAHPFDLLFTATARKLGFVKISRGESVVLRLSKDSELAGSISEWGAWHVTRAYTQGTSG